MKESPIYGINDEIEYEEVIAPKRKFKRAELPEGADKVKLDNVVNISEDSVAKIQARTDKARKKIADTLLQSHIPVLVSFDEASAYAESVMRDILGVEIEIGDDVTPIINNMGKLALVCLFSKMIDMPQALRKHFVYGIASKLVDESIAEMKKSSSGKKYSQVLRELTANVVVGQKSADGDNDRFVNSVGVKKSRPK